MAAARKAVIGRLEDVAFPDWGIDRVRARIDTGAKTTALHVEDIRLLPNRGVSFEAVTGTRARPRKVRIVTRLKRVARVKSSRGAPKPRYFVETRLRLGRVERRVEVNLADRRRMKYRVLIGRSALKDRFMVDVTRSLAFSGRRPR